MMKQRKPIPRKRAKPRNKKGLFDHLIRKAKTDEWIAIRGELEQTFFALGINYCELRLEGCMGRFGLAFAHSKKRNYIATEPKERAREMREVVKACSACHHFIEHPTREQLEPTGENAHEYMYRIVTEAIKHRG